MMLLLYSVEVLEYGDQIRFDVTFDTGEEKEIGRKHRT